MHNAYGYGLFTGGMGFHQGAVELGAAVVPASGGMTPRQVTLIRDLRPDILACTPSYAIRLGEALAEAGVRPGEGLGLRAGLFGAEPWSRQLRARIEELLGLRALDIYGLSEVIGPGVACECYQAADGLHVNEDHFLVEAVNGATGEPVPDGTLGELVFSTVTREALPLLRYRTGDVASLRRGTCECGRTLVRMSKVAGRRDDMLVLRGVNVYPSEVERVLLAEPGICPDYLLVVDEREPASRLIACCEYITAGAAGPPARRRPATGRPSGTCPPRGSWSPGSAWSSGWACGCGCCRRARCRAASWARRCGWCAGGTAARRCRAWSSRAAPRRGRQQADPAPCCRAATR